MRWSLFTICFVLVSVGIAIGIFKSRKPSVENAKSSIQKEKLPFEERIDAKVTLTESMNVLPELRSFHQSTADTFGTVQGFGRTRGGAHVLIGEGAVKFVIDSIEVGSSPAGKETAAGDGAEAVVSISPYGPWGTLGTRYLQRTSELQQEAVSTSSKTPAVVAGPATPKIGFEYLAPSSTNDPGFPYSLTELLLVSANTRHVFLAEMKQLHVSQRTDAPTREMDSFEEQAFEKLLQGEEVVVGDTEAELRMLGSLRSNDQCISCHHDAPGEMLGAFSYRFSKK